MILHVRKWLERGKFVLMFCLFTFVLYHILSAVAQWLEPTQRYKEPVGRAVKVFQDHGAISDQGSMADRLKLFYWMGE
ncbi:DUF4227 family protein [Paenibacillus piri]|uniref:DUF4227 family protein n=1 Tax=Paenibacillus piri TaxID=2547395 RepID=A0A4R5KTS2_9BACL|nr:DUF4227 family protein [Paenibacillus piri]TDF99271.1 DUF4227 family protein [Paenibacillus piri]